MNELSMLCILLVLSLGQSQEYIESLIITNTNVISDNDSAIIIGNGSLNKKYDETIFNQFLNCRNGNLKIINQTQNTSLSLSYLSYDGSPINSSTLNITVSPNNQPQPYISYLDQNRLVINFNCPVDITNYNYYNKITVLLFDQILFSFLLDCDVNSRHKTFEFGYLIISVIDAIILIGVAMHSYVWSVKISKSRLAIELTWIPVLICCCVGFILLFGLYIYAAKDYTLAFFTVTYAGIFVAIFFVFLCFNQCFFLNRTWQKPVYKMFRICEIMSIVLTIGITILAFFQQSWILYNIQAVCICVGSIKIFHFRSLKQAYISMGIMVVAVTTGAVILHVILQRSYNDYATQLSSPLFVMVPDLTENLYKQCSWLPVTEIIIPGVTLSYLRSYDENRSSKYGGVYTVWGNIIFIMSTVLWITIEAVFPYSVPFCIVTYTSLMFVIFIISYKRNEWLTLYHGTFEQNIDKINDDIWVSHHQSVSRLLPSEVLDEVKNNQNDSRDSIVKSIGAQ